MAAVVSHRIVTPGLTGLSAYADWWQILGDLCSEGEQVVSFNAQRLGTSALLEDVRLAAVWFTVGQGDHVVAALRDVDARSSRVSFRVYDNDSRRRGAAARTHAPRQGTCGATAGWWR